MKSVLIFIVLFIFSYFVLNYIKEKIDREEYEKTANESEILIYENKPGIGLVLVKQGFTPINYSPRFPCRIRLNSCGKYIQIDNGSWDKPVIRYRDCKSQTWETITTSPIQKGKSITITTVK